MLEIIDRASGIAGRGPAEVGAGFFGGRRREGPMVRHAAPSGAQAASLPVVLTCTVAAEAPAGVTASAASAATNTRTLLARLAARYETTLAVCTMSSLALESWPA